MLDSQKGLKIEYVIPRIHDSYCYWLIKVEAIVEVIVEVLAGSGRRLDIISVIGSDYTSTACSPPQPNSAPFCEYNTFGCSAL